MSTTNEAMPPLDNVMSPTTDEVVVPELDSALFEAAINLMYELPPMDAAMGAVAAGRNAFGQIEAYLLPSFRVSFDSGEHVAVLDATRSMKGSVVVMALGNTQNRVGREVPNYGVFWRDAKDAASLWHTNVVTLDPDRYGKITGS
jgi:hypothetical protein